MLDALRKRSTGWVAQLLIGLLVLSFAVWGVSGFFTGIYANTIATVGKTDIEAASFARQYDQALQATTRQLGRPVTPDQAQLFGLPGQVLGRLISQATLDDTARQYGLGISNEVLARKIAEDPAFRGPTGSFERNYFNQVLRDNGYSEDQYVRDQQAVFLRVQISNALVSGAHTPDPYLRALHEFRSEARDIDYITLTPSVAGDVGEPDSTEITSYFEENRSRWEAPEYRSLILFEVTPADIADPEEITDEQAQAAYDTDIADYTKPERRKVSQLHFNTGDEAKIAATAITAGKSFDDVALERKLSASDIDLGLVTRDQIIDPKVADAAFALSQGETSDAIEGDFGWMIVRVEDIQAGESQAFATVKDKIKNEIALRLATRRIIETFDEVEDARAGGETLAEIARKIDAELVTIEALDRSGNDLNGTKISPLPGGSNLISGVFASDVGIENDAIRTAENGYVWYEVSGVTAERERELDEVRDSVVAAWKAFQVDEHLTKEAEDIRVRLAAGEDINSVAVELELEVRKASKLTRTTQPPAGLSPGVISATFDGPKGYAAVADGAATTDSKVVLKVSEVVVPPYDPADPIMVQARRQISDQIANDYLQQFLVEKQDQLGVTINQATLQTIVGQVRPGY